VKGAARALAGGGAGRAVGAALGLAAIGAWVLGGAKAALHEAATQISKATSPRLRSTWFSSTYWRVSGLAALLTLPFLFAAAIQALIRSDLGMLAQATFGYLPLALLLTSLAAPLTTLLLAASDEMCAIVSSATGGASTSFLQRIGFFAGGLSTLDGSPFLAVFTGALLMGAALSVSLELLLREAAVYVVVLMMPLAFAALVWPARRVWAVRAVETLVALILAKFAIVAVLALAGGALGAGGASGMLAGTALVMLAAFSPWVLFRVLPFAELAGGVSGALRGQTARFTGEGGYVDRADAAGGELQEWASSLVSRMERPPEPNAPDEHPQPAPAADERPASGHSVAGEGPADGHSVAGEDPADGHSVAGEDPADDAVGEAVDAQASAHAAPAASAGGIAAGHILGGDPPPTRPPFRLPDGMPYEMDLTLAPTWLEDDDPEHAPEEPAPPIPEEPAPPIPEESGPPIHDEPAPPIPEESGPPIPDEPDPEDGRL
jgi:hypothetical protein